MLNVLKDYLQGACEKWLAEIEASPDSRTQIDISRDFLRIFQKMFLHVIYGADIDSFSVKIQKRQKNKAADYERKELSLSDAVEEVFQ